MKYSLKLFGYQIDCNLIVENDSLRLTFKEEDQSKLKDYLIRVLPRYGRETTSASSLEELVQSAIDVEKSLNGSMSEPKIKLPYEFQPEIKEKLIEAAELQDVSATQLLIRLIEEKYQDVMK